jgi:hypothetical protein
VEHLIEGEGKIIAAFGQRMLTYDTAGIGHFPQKTLYWHDPISGFIPMKDTFKWTHFQELRNVIANAVWASNQLKKES